jgi:hypothetical protein
MTIVRMLLPKHLHLECRAWFFDSAGSPEHVIKSGAGFVVSSYQEILPLVHRLVSNPQHLLDMSSKAYDYSLTHLSEMDMYQSYRQYFG